MVNGIEKVCILIDGKNIQSWVVRDLQQMVKDMDVEISLITRNTETGISFNERIENFLQDPSWFTYKTFKFISQRLTGSGASHYREPVHINNIDFLSEAEIVTCTPISDGIWNEFPSDVVDQVAETDLAIRFGFGLIKGDILDAPKHGVLSYHHADLREYRGGVVDVYELLDNRDQTGVTVQRLNETLDGGEIISFVSVNIDDVRTRQQLKRRKYTATESILTDAVHALENEEASSIDSYELGELYTAPNAPTVIKYILKNTIGRIHSCLL